MPDDILNPIGVRRLFEEQKPDVALKAIEAAIQYQGLRGYQQALKNGEAADKAMARYGPMIFRKTPQAMGPAIRAMTPPVMTPYQQSQANLAREKFDYSRTNTAASAKGMPDYVIERTSTKPNPDLQSATKVPFINTTNYTTRTVLPRSVAPKPAAPAATNAPSARVSRANAMAKEHPDWTKAQIIEAVRKELK